MKKKKQKSDKVIYMLVFRDDNLKVIKYEDDFPDYDSAMNRRREAQDSWTGEVVLCTGSSRENILNAYPEYRLKKSETNA